MLSRSVTTSAPRKAGIQRTWVFGMKRLKIATSVTILMKVHSGASHRNESLKR